VMVQANENIIVGGYTQKYSNSPYYNFALVRFDVSGSIDSSFGINGRTSTDFSEINNNLSDDHINKLVIGNGKAYAVGRSVIFTADTSGYSSWGVVAAYKLSADNDPIINLSIPYNIVKYSAPARIKLNATATDEDGSLTKVQFFSGTTKLHTEDVYPYGFLWIDVPVGNYTLTAKAFDNSGNVTTSNGIQVSVVEENVPPVVSIISPVDDTTYTAPATVRIIAKAKDPNDKISKVEFYNGTTLIRTEYYYPYTYTWADVQPGTYPITAKAYDDKGLSATSHPVTVTVSSTQPIVKAKTSAEVSEHTASPLRLTLSPNPARNTLSLYLDGGQQDKQSIISVVCVRGGIKNH
jgi:hypothetical protein